LAAALTGFYSWRLILMTFHGPRHADAHTMEHVHESPPVMTVPLILLGIGALSTGFIFHTELIGEGWHSFWGNAIQIASTDHVLEEAERDPEWVTLAPSIFGLFGIAIAYLMYVAIPSLPARLAASFNGVYLFLLNKWYFDELYDALFVRPAFALANLLWQVGDVTLIDGVPNGLAELTTDGSAQAVKLQSGSIAVYAFVMLIGLVALVTVYLVIR